MHVSKGLTVLNVLNNPELKTMNMDRIGIYLCSVFLNKYRSILYKTKKIGNGWYLDESGTFCVNAYFLISSACLTITL